MVSNSHLLGSVGQGRMGMACLCSLHSAWASSGGLEGWELESSEGSFTHMSGGGYMLLAEGLSFSPYGLSTWASLGSLIVWWPDSKSEHWEDGEEGNKRERYKHRGGAVPSLESSLVSRVASFPPFSSGQHSHRLVSRLKEKESRPSLPVGGCQSHCEKDMWDEVDISIFGKHDLPLHLMMTVAAEGALAILPTSTRETAHPSYSFEKTLNTSFNSYPSCIPFLQSPVLSLFIWETISVNGYWWVTHLVRPNCNQ